jgi:hypothetical protein
VLILKEFFQWRSRPILKPKIWCYLNRSFKLLESLNFGVREKSPYLALKFLGPLERPLG